MNRNIFHTIVASVMFCACVNAQQNTTAGGGNATGSGGSVSYSVGQIDHITQTGSGTASQGVQQPYVFMTTKGPEVKGVELGASVYPNPTSEFILLSLSSASLGITQAELYSEEGKLLLKKNVTGLQTQISLKDFANGNYFLSVLKNAEVVKQFKIVKAVR